MSKEMKMTFIKLWDDEKSIEKNKKDHKNTVEKRWERWARSAVQKDAVIVKVSENCDVTFAGRGIATIKDKFDNVYKIFDTFLNMTVQTQKPASGAEKAMGHLNKKYNAGLSDGDTIADFINALPLWSNFTVKASVGGGLFRFKIEGVKVDNGPTTEIEVTECEFRFKD